MQCRERESNTQATRDTVYSGAGHHHCPSPGLKRRDRGSNPKGPKARLLSRQVPSPSIGLSLRGKREDRRYESGEVLSREYRKDRLTSLILARAESRS